VLVSRPLSVSDFSCFSWLLAVSIFFPAKFLQLYSLIGLCCLVLFRLAWACICPLSSLSFELGPVGYFCRVVSGKRVTRLLVVFIRSCSGHPIINRVVFGSRVTIRLIIGSGLCRTRLCNRVSRVDTSSTREPELPTHCFPFPLPQLNNNNNNKKKNLISWLWVEEAMTIDYSWPTCMAIANIICKPTMIIK